MKKRMEQIIEKLNTASDAYYNGRDEIMSNKEWDALFDELASLEAETDIILPDSPTQKVSADSTKGSKEKHEFPALSLAKTKDVKDLVKWADNRMVWLSWKLDGLTLVATYDNGKLSKLLTRGNGTVGTNITHKASAIHGIPASIPYKGHLVVRGEALISYEDFERINMGLEEGEKYSNPRNLAAGTLNLDDLDEIRQRNVALIAFTPVFIDTSRSDFPENMSSWGDRMDFLSQMGFEVVDHVACETADQLIHSVGQFTDMVTDFPFPVDGLVICYEDWEYSQTGSVTGHHATRAGYAFKWQDETAETVIRNIEWSDSRTGLFNPVAVFDPVELCGTTVSRASLFNLSYVNEKDIKIGDRVTVFKANMIIPQIDENLDREEFDLNASLEEISRRYNLPTTCPHCGYPLGLYETDGTTTVRCANPRCHAKIIGELVHFCERDGMNIKGLSKAKLEQLLTLGIIKDIPSLLNLPREYNSTGHISFTNKYGDDELLEYQEGWGKESVANLVREIQYACAHANFIGFMYAMGIPNFGKGQAKLLAPAIIRCARENPEISEVTSSQDDFLDALSAMVWDGYDFTQIEGFGEVIANSLTDWVERKLIGPWIKGECDTDVTNALKYITFVDTYADYVKDTSGSPIEGLTFVVTGDVHIFKNRKEVEAKIEELGGKLSGSVSKNTSYLICNDKTTGSSKMQKAKVLGIPVLSEEEFCSLIGM